MTITNISYKFAAFAVLLSAAAASLGLTGVSAVVDNTPDCDEVAIIKCGVFSQADLKEKTGKGDVPKVFNAFGISQQDLSGEFVDGVVWRDGRVTVGDKVVATDAMTAGRNFGGTPIPGTDAGKFSTSKFATEGQTAFVRMVNGKFSFAIIKACGNPVSATPKETEQPKPAYACTKLTVEQISRTKFRFTATATATGGAAIQEYQFGFGDGMGISVPEKTYTYEYKKAGTYDTSVVVHVKVNGKIVDADGPSCKKTITVHPQDKPEVCIYNKNLPKDSPDCKKPIEKCDIKGKENLPKQDSRCQEVLGTNTETPGKGAGPSQVAATGPEAVLSGIFGSGALGYGIYSFTNSRRALINKFMGRK